MHVSNNCSVFLACKHVPALVTSVVTCFQITNIWSRSQIKFFGWNLLHVTELSPMVMMSSELCCVCMLCGSYLYFFVFLIVADGKCWSVEDIFARKPVCIKAELKTSHSDPSSFVFTPSPWLRRKDPSILPFTGIQAGSRWSFPATWGHGPWSRERSPGCARSPPCPRPCPSWTTSTPSSTAGPSRRTLGGPRQQRSWQGWSIFWRRLRRRRRGYCSLTRPCPWLWTLLWLLETWSRRRASSTVSNK